MHSEYIQIPSQFLTYCAAGILCAVTSRWSVFAYGHNMGMVIGDGEASAYLSRCLKFFR
jgi:hypothetical protein